MDSTQNITQPSLAIDIERDKLSYLIYGHDIKPEMATIIFDNGDDLKQALENAVYDTPLLLEEYGHTTIVLHSQHFVVMPAELMPLASQVFQASFQSRKPTTGTLFVRARLPATRTPSSATHCLLRRSLRRRQWVYAH